MIKSWSYNNVGDRRDYVKNIIFENTYKSIDVGASAMNWSYPECKFVADIVTIEEKDLIFFKINLEDKNSWEELLDFVKINGKFDFSICSHTLEDIFNPLDLLDLLQKISKKGFVAIPSKYDEFTKLYNNQYRGNAHHKHVFDIKNDTLVIYPKYSWSETDVRTNEIIKDNKGCELSFFWENKIPFKIFGEEEPFKCDQDLINNFYNNLID